MKNWVMTTMQHWNNANDDDGDGNDARDQHASFLCLPNNEDMGHYSMLHRLHDPEFHLKTKHKSLLKIRYKAMYGHFE